MKQLAPSLVVLAFGLAFTWMGVSILRRGRLTVTYEDERSILAGLTGVPYAGERRMEELTGKDIKPRAYGFIAFGCCCALLAVFLAFGDVILEAFL